MLLFGETSSTLAVPWRVLAPLVLAGVALYLLLPKPRQRPVVVGALLGLAAVVLGGVLLTRLGRASLPESVLFYTFSALAMMGSAAMLTQRNPARAAISFALVVMNVCGLFLLQGAPFLMAATIIIYAGAIIVTFLFVLMLAQQRGFSDADDRTREPFLATFSGFVLLGTLLIVIDRTYPDLRAFDDLIARADAASEKDSLAEINAALGDKNAFIASLQEQDRRLRSSSAAQGLYEKIVNVEEELNPSRPDVVMLRTRLRELAAVGHDVQHERGAKAVPAANVAALGSLLYSNHLLPVELGGTLLLVATIGAIAITGRGPRRVA
jgi:NADH:ubiquinone oxidoreductase subunit 6 (subunit J)